MSTEPKRRPLNHLWTTAQAVGVIVTLTGFTPDRWMTVVLDAVKLPDWFFAGIDVRFIAVAVGIALIAGDIIFRNWWGRKTSPELAAATPLVTVSQLPAEPATSPVIDVIAPIEDKPSIAVLPFVNMSDDKSQEYFADGMTEDIITGLSCDSRLFVIARNSTFAYKGQSPDIRTVGKELGVRYVLEGSIRPVGERLRITVQLIETETGTHIWADKIDRPVSEIFDIQDDVVDSLLTTLSGTLGVAEAKRARRQAPENIKAWELCVNAEMSWMGLRTTGGMAEAQALVKKAIEIEPGYALGWAMFAYFSSLNIAFLITDNNDETAKQVEQLINKAAVLAPDDPTVLGYIGYAQMLCGKASTGLSYLERSLASNSNSGIFRYAYAAVLSSTSQTEDALAQFEIFFRQSPKDPNMGVAYFYKCLALSILGRYSEAEQAASLGIKHQPTFPWLYVVHAGALSGLERHEEAHRAIELARELANPRPQIRSATLAGR